MTKGKSLLIKTLLCIGFVGIVILLAMFLMTEENIHIIKTVFTNDKLTNEQIQDELGNLGIRGYITISILSMLQVILTFVPSEPTQVLAGLTFGFVKGLAACLVGVFVGNTIVFLLYKLWGDKLNKFFDKELHLDINKISNSRVVTIVILALYILPVVPYGIICFFAATMRMKYPKYIIITMIGAMPSEALGVILGHAALATSWMLSVGIFAVLAILIVLFCIHKNAVMGWINDFIDDARDRANGKFSVKKYSRHKLALPYRISRLLLCRKVKIKYDYKVKRVEQPSIVLVNHGSFIDFVYAGTMLRKQSPNFVVARLYFFKKLFRNILREFGCFPKSMFCADIESAKNCLQVLRRNGVLAMMPEARLSTAGEFEDIQEGTYSFLKKAGVNVYTIKINGDYLAKPKWGDKVRKGALVEAELDILMTAEEIKTLTCEEIKQRVENKLYFNEFEWLKAHPEIKYKSKTLAVGLENILTRCPHCHEKYTMATKGNAIFCEKCGFRTEMNSRYEFTESSPFENLNLWYKWQLDEYRREMANPEFSLTAHVELKNSAKKGKTSLYTSGTGVCVLNKDGLTYNGSRDGEGVVKHFPMSEIYRILFGAGEDFEVYEGKEIFYFVPEEKRSCVDWYMVSKLYKEEFQGGN